MNTRAVLLIALSLGPWLVGGAARAEMVVVSARQGKILELGRSQAERLFLGRTSTLPDNTPVQLYDLPPGPARDRFYLRLTGKNPAQIRAYWSRQVFTGRALPPREADSPAQLRDWLAAEANAIGYLAEEEVDARLRILLRVGEP